MAGPTDLIDLPTRIEERGGVVHRHELPVRVQVEPPEHGVGDDQAVVHTAGAALVPLATVPANVDAFQGRGTAYVICKSGGRSMHACEFLVTLGVADVANVAGGTLAWVASGRDVTTGPA